MRQLILRLLLAIVTVALGAAATIYLLGPHAATAAAFERYRTAHRAGDAALLTRLTAAREIAFLDEQRRHALASPRSVVETLSYRQRLTILGLRSVVLDGRLPLEILRDTSPHELYAATRPALLHPRALDKMSVVFAVPKGGGRSTGYLSLTDLPGLPGQHLLIAVAWGTAFDFERQADGSWLVDPTPLHETSAAENKYWATRREPTGNEFLTRFYFRASPERAAALWQPLM